jgi:3-oxoacyl-[acyl-carrier protein] reductase
MDLGIRGRKALVTGASAGLGWASARALAAEGADVAICSRDAGRVEEAAAAIRAETGGRIEALVADVSVRGEPARLVAEAAERFGGLNILVANAGGPPSGFFADAGEDEFGIAIDRTFRSAERLIRAALPALRESGFGRIVCLTSITAKEPHQGLLLSNAMRPAVHGLAKSLSKEIASDGITINCVCPGYTNTTRLGDLAAAAAARRGVTPEDVFAGWRANIPRGELGRPEEVADVVAFLCSARASYVNGVSLAVDGGESHSLL